MNRYRLHGRPGWGSVIVELQLHAPGLAAIAQRVIDEPKFRAVLQRNFPQVFAPKS